MILKPPEKMTADSLTRRVDLHRSTAAMFRQHGQFKMAREFDETAQRYQNEIDARAGGSSLEVWTDPDR
jgi:hypothetical protein